MKIHTRNYPIKFENALCAYLLAVISASFTFIVPDFLSGIYGILSGTGFESATTEDAFTKLQHLSVMTLLMFVAGLVFVFFTAIIPFTVGMILARQLKISHWSYFVVGAVFTAITLESLVISIPNLGINVQEQEPSFWEKYSNGLPYFLASGTISGIVCCLYFRRVFTRQR
jgi:hypothetical protein